MKKILAPALLCVAYTAVLAGIFSTDFVKESFFQQKSPSPAMVVTLPSDALGPQLKHSISSKSTIKSNSTFSSAASPEGTSR